MMFGASVGTRIGGLQGTADRSLMTVYGVVRRRAQPKVKLLSNAPLHNRVW